jgi:hypothetical protein
LLTAITGTVLTEIVASPPKIRKRLIEATVARVDVYLPFEARELLRMELTEKDPASWVGDQVLHGTGRLSDVIAEVDESEVREYNCVNEAQDARIKVLAPEADSEIRMLTGLETFRDYVSREEVVGAMTFLAAINVDGRLGEVDLSPGTLKSLLGCAQATRMGVLMALAYHYRRAKRWVENRNTPTPGGALSDAPVLGAAAYAQVLLTADAEFVAYGNLVNEVVAEPQIRRWELT